MRKIFGLLSLLLTIITVNAQNSPEQYRITSMVDFTEFPTGSATGIPDVKLPLFQTTTRGNVDIDLSLQYNLLGSQHTEMLGSQFGDAWNLTFLGTISREVTRRNSGAPSVQYRVPDENYFANAGANPENTFADIYTYNILGYEGKFSVSKVNNEIIPVLIENNDYVSIEIDYDSNGVNGPVFNSLTIKDKHGNSYIFEDTGVYGDNKYFYSKYNPGLGDNLDPGLDPNPDDPDDPYTVMEAYGPPYIRSWHLSKVIDRYGNNLFTMEYETTLAGMTQVNYLKKINITNKGSISFNNQLQTSLHNLTNNYTTDITIKNSRGQIIKTIVFAYTKRTLSMDNGDNYFSKLFLTRIKQFDKNQTESEDYEIKYKLGATGNNATIKGGFVFFKKCFGNYKTFNDVATYMTLQKIVHPTGANVLYQFESNTYESESSMYKNQNIFNKEYLTITPVFNSSTLQYSFNVPQGYSRLVIKNRNNLALRKDGQYLISLSGTGGSAQLDEYCTKQQQFSSFELQGAYGTFHITGVTSPYLAPDVPVLAIRDKAENEMEKFLYGYGSRIKRIAYFSSTVADNYLETNPIATTADKEIHFDYTENGNMKLSAGRLKTITDPLSDSFMASKLLYEKVTTTITDIGRTEAYYNNVSTADPQWDRKNLLPKELLSYSDNDILTSKQVFDRIYTQVNGRPVLSKETVNTKTYEGTSFTEQSNEVTYDLTHRYPTEVISTLPAISETLKQTNSYSQLGNVFVKSASEGFLNGNKVSASAYHYNSHGDLLYTETAKSTLPLTKVGNEITRITDGRVEEYKQQDGTYVSRIWGYDNTEVVAELKNVQYSEIAAGTISNIKLRSGSVLGIEAMLVTALNSLRTAHPEALITTYIYTPMVGMKSSTDANGRKETYEYDNFNRLHRVLNHEGNVIKEYNYNIKN